MGSFPIMELEKLSSSQQALGNGDDFGHWGWKHQEGLWLLTLCILLQDTRSDFILYTVVTSEM